MAGGAHSPDFARLKRTLLRQEPPGPVPFAELKIEDPAVEAVVGKLPKGSDEEARARRCELIVRCYQNLGYDYVSVRIGMPLKRSILPAADTAQPDATRDWQNEGAGDIACWADFERFPWPSPQDIDYWDIEHTAKYLPEGMAIIVRCNGILEWVMWLMGFESFALALIDEPDLVEAVFKHIEELVTSACAHVVQMPYVGAFWLGDDMGFATSTMISPRLLRHYVFPRQHKLAEAAHAQGKPFLLHSCGNVTAIMDDLIDVVGIDAKHSFEDKITPVEEAMQRWGDRIAIVGGVDMDIVARGTEEQVRSRTRQILESCGPHGGYCLGTGNTVANYVPAGNYLAMLDEGRSWNLEHFGTT
jgi:uroporphyrinogen decarboxylase